MVHNYLFSKEIRQYIQLSFVITERFTYCWKKFTGTVHIDTQGHILYSLFSWSVIVFSITFQLLLPKSRERSDFIGIGCAEDPCLILFNYHSTVSPAVVCMSMPPLSWPKIEVILVH